jgi:heptosyltransferase-2
VRILVRMPNWLGDAVMATPALNNLRDHFPQAEFVLVGSPAVAELFAGDPRFRAVVADRSRAARFRAAGIWRLGRELRREHGPFDAAWTFQNSASSRLLLRALRAPLRIARKYSAADILLTHPVACDSGLHHAEIYNSVVNGYLGTAYATGPTTLPGCRKHAYGLASLGVHPGAAYGSAKRWEPAKFAAVAADLACRFQIVLFAGPRETELAAEIATRLHAAGVQHVTNLAGQTSIAELVSHLAGLDLFLCNDSGPMHIAGACGVPTVAIFGSTDPRATRPWRHAPFRCVRRELPCSPCQERVCPLGHHACMRQIEADEVLAAAWSLVAPECRAPSESRLGLRPDQVRV